MNSHPLNLLVRFLLELALLGIAAYWAWKQFDGILRYISCIGLPLLIAVSWGVFRVNGDPKKAIVPVPGWVRLLFEFFVFGLGTYFLLDVKMYSSAYIFLSISIIHYIISFDRVRWLLRSQQN